MNLMNSHGTRSEGRRPSPDSRRLILLVSAVCAVAPLWFSCGPLKSTANLTQTAAPGSATPNPVATLTLTTTPSATPGTLSLASLDRLPVDLVSPAFSPDGSEILGGGQDGLMVGSADGTNLHVLLSKASANVTGFAWSPDGSKIAVTVVPGGITSSTQPSDLVIMNPDGSSPVDVGKNDFPTYFQFLPDGRLAFVRDAHLHLFTPPTGVDAVAANASAIINDASAALVPFLVSDDGSYIARQSGTMLTLQNVATGASTQLTNTLDLRGWSGYGWSPSGVLAYADIDATRVPSLHLYEPSSASDQVVLRGTESGVFSGVRWSNPRWLLFVFYPSGTVAEELSQYQAFDTLTETTTQLFSKGMGFRVSGGGSKLGFGRSQGLGQPAGEWVATLATQ